MLFRNLTLYRFPRTLSDLFQVSMEDALSDLNRRLAEHPLQQPGSLQLRAMGFMPPFGSALSHRVGDCILITLGSWEKVLPAAVVNSLLSAKVAELEEREGQRLGFRARRRLKEEIVHDCLPRAFLRPGRLDAYFDLARGLLVLDTPTRGKAETFVSQLRHALGSFPALPLNAQASVMGLATDLVAGHRIIPESLALGEEIELIEPAGDAVVRAKCMDLASDEIDRHLEAGMQVSRLALVHQQRVGFVLCEDLVLRRLAFLDGALDGLGEAETREQELDARFALMTAEVGRLFDLLDSLLDFSKPDGEPEASRAVRRAAQQLQRLASEDGTAVEITNERGEGVRIDKAGVEKIIRERLGGAV